MSPAAGPALPSDHRTPVMIPTAMITPPATEIAAKDAIIGWYRGEFAAANAIIDALCNHLTQISSTGGANTAAEYEAVFTAIHRRRLNWIPVLQMQKYFSISDVAIELKKVAQAKMVAATAVTDGKEREEVEVRERREKEEEREKREKEEREELGSVKCNGNGNANGNHESEDSPDSELTDTGSQDHIQICDNHEECGGRREHIRMTKGFVAKEPVKGHMVNVVKGLKMYDDVFTYLEISKLNDFVDELRAAGQNGELLGETYVLFNKQMKGNKREQIQLGVPVFGQIKDDASNEEQKTNIEQIPVLLQSVIDHLVQWQILPENRKPNGCLINFFDEGEYSQPYLQPPHLDQPVCTLLLSESTLAFGRTLLCDGDGNFKGHLMLPLKEGSVLVMRNNSADMARHAMCASPSKRVSITFFRVRPNIGHNRHSPTAAPMTQAMTPWRPSVPNPPTVPMDIAPKWGVIRAPMVMFAPMRPMAMNARRIAPGGTGVFLPWAIGSRKRVRHLPPRAQKARLLALTSGESHVSDTMSDPGVEGNPI